MSAPESTDATAAGRPEYCAPNGDLLEQVARMTKLASCGEWQRLEGFAARISAMSGQWPAGGQSDELIAAKAGIERVMALATAARNEIGDKLTAIRHGQRAMASYRATGTLHTR